ncbi:hypothetical protein [Paraburkholderia phytofirmans]|nr:hypothetical protein [Paraburkholderia phytofirmans]
MLATTRLFSLARVASPSSAASLIMLLLLIVPLLVSLSFMLVADIDSPRGGVIRVKPLNLHALADSIRSH